MGEWLRAVVLGGVLIGCGGVQPRHEPRAKAYEASAALPAPAPSYPTVTRIAATNDPAPAPPVDANTDAPPVLLHDHGSGRYSASFPELPVSPAPSSAAPTPAPAPPSAPAPSASAVKPSGGQVSNAALVVAAMRAGFRACYQAGLAQERNQAGSVRLTIRVGPDGSIAGVTSAPSGYLLASVVDCVVRHAHASKFDPPEGGSAVIAIPVTFVSN